LWNISNLEPGRKYRYTARPASETAVHGEGGVFSTPPVPEARRKVKIAFGSCANTRRFPKQRIWSEIEKEEADTVVLLGDTPYIDSTRLKEQRRKYREFYSLPGLKSLFRHTPFYGVWDDHDFGKDDSDGFLKGKESSRQAFIEYHGNPSYGDGREGVYCRFRRGPVEVFLLDTRWFANTEPSPFDKDKPSLLGKTQWNWLFDSLKTSEAPFKILACGIVWDDAVGNKHDHWFAYRYELDALFRFLGENRISGVVLVGGDIHRSRVFKHPTKGVVGYDLFEFDASPLANKCHTAVPSTVTETLFDVGEEESFLMLTGDSEQEPASLTAEFFAPGNRKLYSTVLDASSLSPG